MCTGSPPLRPFVEGDGVNHKGRLQERAEQRFGAAGQGLLQYDTVEVAGLPPGRCWRSTLTVVMNPADFDDTESFTTPGGYARARGAPTTEVSPGGKLDAEQAVAARAYVYAYHYDIWA